MTADDDAHSDALKRVHAEVKRHNDLAAALVEHERVLRSKFIVDLLSGQFRKRPD